MENSLFYFHRVGGVLIVGEKLVPGSQVSSCSFLSNIAVWQKVQII